MLSVTKILRQGAWAGLHEKTAEEPHVGGEGIGGEGGGGKSGGGGLGGNGGGGLHSTPAHTDCLEMQYIPLQACCNIHMLVREQC